MWRVSSMSRWSCCNPLNINPNCLAFAPLNWSNRLKATATATFALFASSTAWINAQLSLSLWSLNIQYTTGPPRPVDGPNDSFKTLILPGCTAAGDGIAMRRCDLMVTCAGFTMLIGAGLSREEKRRGNGSWYTERLCAPVQGTPLLYYSFHPWSLFIV